MRSTVSGEEQLHKNEKGYGVHEIQKVVDVLVSQLLYVIQERGTNG
jgi:hypothetical protein